MSFKIIVFAILGLSFGAIYLTHEPGELAVPAAAAENAVEAPAEEVGAMARIIAMFTGSGSSAEKRDPPQVIRGGSAMHGGSDGRFMTAPER